MKLAAIDIGSNSIKLVVVDAAASDPFVVLAREKETVRFGHETLREGVIIDRRRVLEDELRPPVPGEVDPRLRAAAAGSRDALFKEVSGCERAIGTHKINSESGEKYGES